MSWLFLASSLALVSTIVAWHDPSQANTNYHCWPKQASAYLPTPLLECPGVAIDWVTPPETGIKVGMPFNTTYRLVLSDEFWDWVVKPEDPDDILKKNFFASAGPSGFTNGSEAKAWCLGDGDCSGFAPSGANAGTCCIHHVNVHTCPLEGTHAPDKGLCGPWIPKNGSIFTHSNVMVGSIQRENWTSTVAGFGVDGLTAFLAHFKVAGMHIGLNLQLSVFPRTICGDGLCESDDGEDCATCPKDCGKCPLKAWEIGLIVAAAAAVVLTIAGIIGYFQYQQQKILWDESWIINFEDIKPDTTVKGFMGSAISVQSGMSGASGRMAKQAAEKQVFTETANFDGRTVAIRKIQKSEFQLTKAVRKEVKVVRTADHPNLCRFIGGCLEVPNVSIVVEYCPKGSLNDVLMNEDVPLNWGFRFSFAGDVARAVHYLHTHCKIYHGRLKSQNCLVDDRWTVKVTDYGLPLFRKVEGETDEEAEYYQFRSSRAYMAPEVLPVKGKATPTPSMDAYSYAMILEEIATRSDLYGDDDPDNLPASWRPKLPTYEDEEPEYKCPCPQEVNNLIRECWVDDPALRPSFDTIRKVIYRINPDKQSPVDMMMSLMEKYSKHLEVLVGERTAELEVEKQKTDRLLYSMLPRAVADLLRQGHQVEPEAFNNCTIYFSDIVGFTSLSGGSTPFEVVALLNKLYTVFDEIIDQYDVYKVETIGDAYMVVSGIPIRNGDNHAREVANMTIDLVRASKVFVVPHRPGMNLKIRVGLHTGSACAGVVGLKMPRYCLFGDTVNTASRMESNGEAYKIHVSSFTYDLLKKTGGFKMVCRGAIPIKGKGDMTTWWITGREGEPKDTELYANEADPQSLA